MSRILAHFDRGLVTAFLLLCAVGLCWRYRAAIADAAMYVVEAAPWR